MAQRVSYLCCKFLGALLTCTSRSTLSAVINVSFHATYPNAPDNTLAIETRRRHTIKNRDKCLAYVQALEIQLVVVSRWMPDSTEFLDAAQKVAMRQYQRALDNLEGLVVARLFELTSMNRSQMGESRIPVSV